MDEKTSTPLERFLKPLAQLRHDLPAEADLNELIAQNIAMSVRNIVSTDVSISCPLDGRRKLTITTQIIQNNWEKSKQEGGPKSVWVHGWMYNLTTGLIKDLEVTQGPEGQSPPPEPPLKTPLAPQL
jgi:carbonic anhydrase